MKIIDNSRCEFEFNELEVGATFKSDGNYYIKTMEVETFDSRYNAVCLDDGEYEFFAQDYEVIPFNCELIVL